MKWKQPEFSLIAIDKRKSAGLSQKELANRMSLSLNSIQSIENGTMMPPIPYLFVKYLDKQVEESLENRFYPEPTA